MESEKNKETTKQKIPPLPPAIAGLKRKRNEQNSFAWYQYMIVPDTIRNINIYKLNKFPGFVPDDFNTFQNQLLALGVAKFIDERDAPESMSLSDISVKFYAYFVGRMKADRMMHLLTFSYLNERIPHDLLKNFDFFQKKSNLHTIGMTGAKKQVQIKFTKTYKTTPFHISASLREVFVNSKDYWIAGKKDRSRKGLKAKNKKSSVKKTALGQIPLLCELKFDKVINEAREMFVVSCIRAGVDKETIAKFCASQFLGSPIKSWHQVLIPKAEGSSKSDSVVTAQETSRKVVSRWDWTLDPRDYVLKTWRFMAGVPTSTHPDVISLQQFQRKIISDYGTEVVYYVKDFYNPNLVEGLVYDHPEMIRLFGPYIDRGKRLIDYFSSENIYDIFKFMFSDEKYLDLSSKAIKIDGTKVEVKARLLCSSSKRYLALVLMSVSKIVDFENPVKFEIPASSNNALATNYIHDLRSYMYESMRFLVGYPIDSNVDTMSLQRFLNDLKQYKSDKEKLILYQVIDHHLHHDKALVYESPRISELFGGLKERHAHLQTPIDLITLWNVAKFIFLGKAFNFEIEALARNGVSYCISAYINRSSCGRYHGRIIQLQEKN